VEAAYLLALPLLLPPKSYCFQCFCFQFPITSIRKTPSTAPAIVYVDTFLNEQHKRNQATVDGRVLRIPKQRTSEQPSLGHFGEFHDQRGKLKKIIFKTNSNQWHSPISVNGK
jgi:hypothetical protein